MIPIIGLIITLIILIIGLFVKIINGACESDKIFEGGIHKDKYQTQAARAYKHLINRKSNPTFNDFCYPKSYNIQPQQTFAGDYMRPGSGHTSLLVFHTIGSGKTCTSIQIGKKWLRQKAKPVYIMPASLIPGFRNELRSPCGGYISADESAELRTCEPGSPEYAKIIAKSNARIDADFSIWSYNKFAKAVSTFGAKSIKGSIIIIDEVQNINNQKGKYFNAILQWIEAHPDAPSVIMSGTPIFDTPAELYMLAKLLRIDVNINGKGTNLKEIANTDVAMSVENIHRLFAGKVTYFAGAPEFTFPTVYVKKKKCLMSKHQARWYKSEVEAEMTKAGGITLKEIANDFYIKSRQRSNIVYPNGLTGVAGMHALTTPIIRNSLETYSIKYHLICKKILRGGLSFIYTGFTGAGGIAALTKCMRALGFSDYTTDGPGKRRYVIWSGEQTLKEKDVIREVFNSSANDDGSQIQVVIGSPSVKEGVSFFRIRYVHVVEAYWNHSRLEQIFGRAIRYCSHKSLPRQERDVTIYIYCAVAQTKLPKEVSPLESIDLYMLAIADKKRDEAEPTVKALMDVAVDRYIHYPKKDGTEENIHE